MKEDAPKSIWPFEFGIFDPLLPEVWILVTISVIVVRLSYQIYIFIIYLMVIFPMQNSWFDIYVFVTGWFLTVGYEHV